MTEPQRITVGTVTLDVWATTPEEQAKHDSRTGGWYQPSYGRRITPPTGWFVGLDYVIDGAHGPLRTTISEEGPFDEATAARRFDELMRQYCRPDGE